jgi:dTDP-4-dehydrorhamnose 3,5-epimerase
VTIEELPLAGLKLLRPKVFFDARGFVLESYHAPRYCAAGIPCDFVQDNHSHSIKGTLRGMHFQSTPGQAKLIRVVTGRIFDVCVDIRVESPTFGRWHGVTLDADDFHELFVPVGFAHGFCVLSDAADVIYKTSTVYDARTETGFAWNDPEVAIAWPIARPLLSARDAHAGAFASLRARLWRRGA